MIGPMIGVRFVAVVYKTRTSDYGVHFPDLPGCITAGKTFSEARRMATEVLGFHLAGMLEDHKPIPVPRSLGEIRDDPEGQDATTLMLIEAFAPRRQRRTPADPKSDRGDR